MAAMDRPSYPTPPTSDVVDHYHGTPIADPFRPLEDSDAPAVRAWIDGENALTRGVLDALPERAPIRSLLASRWSFPRAGAPWRRGDAWFQLRNEGLQDQDVLWTADAPDAVGRPLVDPNGLGVGGTTTLASVAVSDSGRMVAVALAEAGSDWRTWDVRRVDSGEVLADRIPWSKFSGAAWTADDAGFFYCRYPQPAPGDAYDAPNRDQEVRYHRVGTDAEADVLVFAAPDEPEWGFEPEVLDDGRLLAITAWRGTDRESRIFVAELARGAVAERVRPLLDAGDASYTVIGAVAGELYLATDRDAPLGRVIAVSIDDPSRQREVIPEAADSLQEVALVGGRLAAVYLHDAASRLGLFDLDGTPGGDVALPGLGTIGALAGRRRDPELYITFEGFASPARVIAVRMEDGTVRTVRTAALSWDPDEYTTEQVFVPSDDGTSVPLFLVHRRDVVPTGDVRTLLYGYGGFRIPIGPMFKPEFLAWMERGGLLAVACLRGGSEYGTAWYEAGRLDRKQNVFDDFAACARWLARSGWTRIGRLGITGRSNGGLLVGASLTQHPELFGATVPEVGVMDMLRFHRFTIGSGWTSDYGSADDPDGFRTLIAYSPLHNVRPGAAYPPTLVTTGDHDDRVVPGHSFKFAAALQAVQVGDAPVLIRIDTDAGHGAGKPVSKLLDERSDVLAFLEAMLAAG